MRSEMTVSTLSDRLPATVRLRGVAYESEAAPQWREWISEEEQMCLESFGATMRRRDFLAGRAAARQVLGERLEVGPGEVSLRRSADGGVDVGAKGWFVSIAHSNGRALAGCAQHPLGVDLERIQSRDPGIVDFLFRPEDRHLVGDLPYSFDASLILCWTLKEAVLKARRSGFRTSPKSLHLDVAPEEGSAVVRLAEAASWIAYFERLDDFWGTVAIPQS